jgi:hypothetical protein
VRQVERHDAIVRLQQRGVHLQRWGRPDGGRLGARTGRGASSQQRAQQPAADPKEGGAGLGKQHGGGSSQERAWKLAGEPESDCTLTPHSSGLRRKASRARFCRGGGGSGRAAPLINPHTTQTSHAAAGHAVR